MKTLNFLVFFALLGFTLACPKATYQYQVLDLPEPTLLSLGEYIVKILKRERDTNPETCHDHNSKYLDVYLDAPKQFDSVKMAGIFMHQFVNSPSEVFIGVEATEMALASDCSFNILITKDMDIRKFLLKNETDGDLFVTYMTEEALLGKMVDNEAWKHVDVVKCENYLFHLSSDYGKQNVTYTVVDKEESIEQMDFSLLTPLGGFFKQGCSLTAEADNDKGKE